MYSRIILFFLLIIIGVFIYLHIENPVVVDFSLTEGFTYSVPVTVLVFAGFFLGVMLAVLNSLVQDTVRAVRELQGKRERKLLVLSEQNHRTGVAELVKGNTQKAMKLFAKALESSPDDPDIIRHAAEAYVAAKKPEEAKRLFKEALLRQPASLELLNAALDAARLVGDTSRSLEILGDILEISPDSPRALRRLSEIRAEASEWSEAAGLQKKLINVIEKNKGKTADEKSLAAALLCESAAARLSHGDSDGAIELARESVTFDSGFLPSYLVLADAHVKAGSINDAIKELEDAYEKLHDVVLLMKLEELFIEQSDPRNIIDKYKKAIEARPDDVNLKLLLARLYLKLEMIDDAIEGLERLAQEGEDGYYQMLLLGEAYKRRDQSDRAATLFVKALGLDKDLAPPFMCEHCGHFQNHVSARCPVCGRWNTLHISSTLTCRSAAT